jgi:hypothetical protein
MNPETKTCQNCKKEFTIESEDFDFYKKMEVPAPTWCPECRMIRRFVWRNEHILFKRKDSVEGNEIFSEYHPDVYLSIYNNDYWYGDKWEALTYGRAYDFSRPFLEQFIELLKVVPLPARSFLNCINSDYSNNISDAKNAYLCFAGLMIENSAYIINSDSIKDCFDMYHTRNAELCYDGFMVDESYQVFFSINCESSFDLWFCKNMMGCNNCFGCINLRKKSYCIFNQQVTKEEYQKFMEEFLSGSFKTISGMKEKAHSFWLKFPERFNIGFKNVNCSGEHIQDSRNARKCFDVHDGQDIKYCQMVTDISDAHDITNSKDSSLVYENSMVALGANNIKFSNKCTKNVSSIYYSIFCSGSHNLFGCISLRNKQYCILNKQYTKEEYEELVPKIIQHMNDMPYIDKMGRVYKYGEFFPPEFSPFAYNETIAQDFFPLSKEEIEKQGFLYREFPITEYQITILAKDLPDDIKDVSDDIVKESIECLECKRAYRIIPMELSFYRRIILPLPRYCYRCRFNHLFKFVNPPKFWKRTCECMGTQSKNGLYQNQYPHTHAEQPCGLEVQTSYAPQKPEIIYCEKCYQEEVS